jgi:hypothetical protein
VTNVGAAIVFWIHLAGGLTALAAGALAASARKGGRLHARAGNVFIVAMLALAATATVLDWLKPEPGPGVGGLFVAYFVTTSWMTARRRDGTTGRFEIVAGVAALLTAAALFWGALTGETTPAGPGPIFAIGTLCLLAGLGDLRAVLGGPLTPRQRIIRHLWRMCLAFFVATGSFFLGQQDVLPAAMRGTLAQFAMAFAPLALIPFWLLRIRFGRKLRAALAALGERPRPVGA